MEISPSKIFPFESTPITLSASPSKLKPISALFSCLAFFNGSRNVEPHLTLIFKPSFLLFIVFTFAPRLLNICLAHVVADRSATTCARHIFKSLGANVKTINNKKDGLKINVKCGSTFLEPLKKARQENNADMGFSFDGDADRVIGVDSKGNILDGDISI